MGTDEDKMIRVREKPANSLHFGGTCILAGAKRVQADDDERVGHIEKSRIEPGSRAIVGHPLDLDDRMTGLRAGLFYKSDEVLLHDMIQEAADSLVKASRIRKCFNLGYSIRRFSKSVGNRFSITSSGASTSPGRLHA